MNSESLPLQSSLAEFLTVEQLAERLQVSRATLFNWMQKGILAQGIHFFKRGRVLRFIWSNDLVQELLTGSPENIKKVPPVKPSQTPIQQNKCKPINWDY